MNQEIVRIQAAVLDKKELTLYTTEGQKIIIPQGDPRVRKIIEIAVPALASNPSVEIDIGTPEENHYAQFEEQSSGVVKFFKVAKAKLKGLFGSKPAAPEPDDDGTLTPQTIGVVPGPATVHVANAGVYEVSEADEVEAAIEKADADRKGLPTPSNTPAMPAVKPPAVERTTMDVMNEIMEHAVPVSAPEFHERGVHKQGNITDDQGTTDKTPTKSDAPDTIIAVVDGKIVPGVELIKTQFARAVKWGSTIGVENFLRRLTAVIDQRQHSVDDLLKFLERADLPIADDGSILIYKVLRRKGDRTNGKYKDCHSGNVEQWTGAYVCMDPKLVDHNRRNECSNGLHVARRGYVSGFSGDVCVLAKLAPEDVIAVPEYDANKMRVCGYHILMELSEKQYELVRRNRPMSDDEEGKQLLANAVAGRHVRMTHEVRITGHKGAGVVVTPLEKGVPVQLACGVVAPGNMGTTAPAAAEQKPEEKPAKPAPVEALANADEQSKVAPEKLQDVVEKVEVEQQLAKTGRQAQAAALYAKFQAGEEGALQALIAFKKASKVSWDKLGITDPMVITVANPQPAKVNRKVEFNDPPKAPVPSPFADKTTKVGKATKAAKAKEKTVETKAPFPTSTLPQYEAKGVKAGQPVTELHSGKVIGETAGSPRERIAKLLAVGLTSVGVAQAILTLKKQSKKSWDVLGVTPEQVAEIVKLSKG
jgi:hypothetical protein